MEFEVNINNVILNQLDQVESGEYNVTECNFTFSSEYDGLTKKAVFTGENGTAYLQTIVDNKCSIPSEILEVSQVVEIGVYAYDVENEELLLRYSPEPTQFYIHQGSYKEAQNSTPPTPSEIEQLQAQITSNKNDIEGIQGDVVDINQDIVDIKAEQITQNENIQTNANNISTINEQISDINETITNLETNKANVTDLNALTERVSTNERDIDTIDGHISDINQNIDDLEQDLTNYSLITETGSQINLNINSSNFQMTAILKDKNGNVIHTSNVIDLPLETMVVGASYDNVTKEVVLTLQNGTTLRFSVADLVEGLVSTDQLTQILSNYYNKTEVNNLLANHYTKSETDTLLNEKANQTSLDTTNQNITNLAGRVSTNEEDIAEIKTEQTTQNTNIEALQTKVEELETDNENLRKALPQIKGEGTDFTLNNTSDNKFIELGLNGNTEQEQLTGKNLFNMTTAENGYINSSGSFATSNTNKCSDYIKTELNKQYILSAYNENMIRYNYIYGVAFYDENKTFISRIQNVPYNTSFTIDNSSINYIRVWEGVNSGETIGYIQLEEGSTATSYEPYCGGIPSPNPDYPQQIKNVTGNANVKIQNKNLFDESIFKQYDTKEDDEAYKMYNSQVYNKDLTPNISFKENTSYTLIYIAKQSSGNPRLAINYDDGTIAECPNTAMSINYTQYMLVTPSNKKIKNISLRYGSTGYVYIKKNSVMVLEGAYTSETIPSYVPHQEQNYPFTFAEGQRGMQGTTLQDDGIHQKHKQRVFDGSDDESWNLQGINANGIANFYIGLSDYSGSSQNLALVNYFLPQTTPIAQTTEEGFYLVSAKTLYIRIKSSIASTVAEFRTWLSTHNLLVEYKLAEEEIISYNETQQAQYNAIKEAISYYKQTNISGSSDELSPIITASAVGDLNLILDTMQSKIDLLEG